MNIDKWLAGSALSLLLVNLVNCSVSNERSESAITDGLQNPLLYATAWKKTAAEYQALYHQGFNLARLRVEQALANANPEGKQIAVISDLDDTLLHNSGYWSELVELGQDFFDDTVWDSWIQTGAATASPGALEFLQFCEVNNVEVFYVTNRDQGEITYANALTQIQTLNFPYADDQHLFVLQGSSNKELTQDQIGQQYNVVALLGDNLNDFSRKYYLTDVSARQALMNQDAGLYGSRYIIFPNPTDGHWIRAIFGESEPAPTQTNRQILRRAATP